jgi:hypothetical protein
VTRITHLRECSVVPKIAVMGEAVSDVAELSLLDVLLDWVHQLFLRDLESEEILVS